MRSSGDQAEQQDQVEDDQQGDRGGGHPAQRGAVGQRPHHLGPAGQGDQGMATAGRASDRATWLQTSAATSFTPAASTTTAGTMVTARRATAGTRQPSRPSSTSCPARLPVVEEASPEASRATAKPAAARGPSMGRSVSWAWPRESTTTP